MNSKWVIIADDFTGAGDSAVQFGSSGKKVRLILNPQKTLSGARSLAAVVVDTDTRFLRPAAAYDRVFAATRELRRTGERRFFKKIDSTLRGNPADEISAVLDAAGYRFAVVAPSAPRNKRTVVDGLCYVDGKLLSETAVARDPFTPVGEARIAKLLESRFPGAIRELSLGAVRSGAEAMKKAILEALPRGARVFVADAETMDDLKSIASLASLQGLLFVGSSGLAEALSGKADSDKPALPRFPRGRTLFVIGSVTPTSAAQCARLVRSGGAAEIVVSSKAALTDSAEEKRRLLGLIAGMSSRMALLIRTSGTDSAGMADAADKEAGVAISRFLGDLTVEAARIRKTRFLFASGGDTAARIAAALGAESIDFISEILPGLPFGFFSSRTLDRRLYFVSKSGGFGDQDAMAKSLALVSPEQSVLKEQRI